MPLPCANINGFLHVRDSLKHGRMNVKSHDAEDHPRLLDEVGWCEVAALFAPHGALVRGNGLVDLFGFVGDGFVEDSEHG